MTSNGMWKADKRTAPPKQPSIANSLLCDVASRSGFKPSPQVVVRRPYIPILDEDNTRQGFLEPGQYGKLLAELPERLKALFVCAYHVGPRRRIAPIALGAG